MLAVLGAAMPSLVHAAPDRIDAIVTSQMKLSDIPGAAIAVVERGRITKLKPYGLANVEWAAPVTPDTRFQLASATKIFTGVLLMRLVERGALSLDDPLTRWFPAAPASWSSVRVRQLANHTSGLSDRLGTPRPQTVDGIVAAAMTTPFAYEPGTDARYGFTDFTVLRAILEKASGLSLPDLLAQEITKPLGLRSTSFAMASDDGMVRMADILPHKAEIYGLRDGKLVTSDFFYAPQGYGAGGLYSSISDLAAFFVALDQGRLLKKASLIALETPATLPNGKKSGFGVGWVARTYRGTPIVGHSGGPALADIIRVEDRQLTIIAVTNQQTFYPLIAEAVLDQFLPSPSVEPARDDDTPALAANMKLALAAAAAGKKADSAFAAAGKAALDQLMSPFARAMLRGVGAPNVVEYLGPGSDGRRYRIVFARKSMVWHATGDASGRIVTLAPE
jgi:CubicO group peptidase (beta-lactamase class C family)